MRVKELIAKLSNCNDEAKLMIIQEEELECMPEYWDDEERKVIGKATKLYSEDLHSHGFYLLAIENQIASPAQPSAGLGKERL